MPLSIQTWFSLAFSLLKKKKVAAEENLSGVSKLPVSSRTAGSLLGGLEETCERCQQDTHPPLPKSWKDLVQRREMGFTPCGQGNERRRKNFLLKSYFQENAIKKPLQPNEEPGYFWDCRACHSHSLPGRPHTLKMHPPLAAAQVLTSCRGRRLGWSPGRCSQLLPPSGS